MKTPRFAYAVTSLATAATEDPYAFTAAGDAQAVAVAAAWAAVRRDVAWLDGSVSWSVDADGLLPVCLRCGMIVGRRPVVPPALPHCTDGVPHVPSVDLPLVTLALHARAHRPVSRAGLAALLGDLPDTVTRYVHTTRARLDAGLPLEARHIPEPDFRVGRGPCWRPGTVRPWIVGRPAKGAGAGRPRKVPAGSAAHLTNPVRPD